MVVKKRRWTNPVDESWREHLRNHCWITGQLVIIFAAKFPSGCWWRHLGRYKWWKQLEKEREKKKLCMQLSSFLFFSLESPKLKQIAQRRADGWMDRWVHTCTSLMDVTDLFKLPPDWTLSFWLGSSVTFFGICVTQPSPTQPTPPSPCALINLIWRENYDQWARHLSTRRKWAGSWGRTSDNDTYRAEMSVCVSEGCFPYLTCCRLR